jgi:predicted enzyme related to lactoylglutathione lyase
MGQPVVHFEVIGTDAKKLQGYYSELFGWEIDANNPMNYGIVQREQNLSPDGVGIGGGIGTGPQGRTTPDTSRFMSRCQTWRTRSQRRRALAGHASWDRKR